MLNKLSLRKIKSFLSLRGAKRRSNLSGFSLIELMVAVGILAMAIFGIFQAYSAGFMGMVDARNVTVATNYAREAMEEIKNKPFEKIVIGGEIATIEYKEEGKFSISTNVKNEIIVIVEEEVEEEKEMTDLQRVITTVSWENRKGETKEVKLEMLVYGYNL